MSAPPAGTVGDANAVVAYNVATIRDRWGWTQDQLTRRLAQLTEQATLSSAATSAIAGAFDTGPRRFDAHELYVLSVVFEVPIAYFFAPPPAGEGPAVLADTFRPAVDVYAALLGRPRQLEILDERLASIDVVAPEATERLLHALFGITGGAQCWPEHYRVWRQDRLRQLRADYAAPIRELSHFLGGLARELNDIATEASLAGLESGQ